MKNVKLTLALLVLSCCSTLLSATEFPPGQQKRPPSNTSEDINREIARLKSTDPIERATAACSLGRMGVRAFAAAPSLAAMLGDDVEIAPVQCRQADQFQTEKTSPGRVAAKALAQMGTPALDFLIAASSNADWKTRQNAVWALGEVKYESQEARARGVQALKTALADSRPEVQETAALAFGEVKDKSTVDVLTDALHNTDWKVRRAAATALAELRARGAVSALSAGLRDEHPQVRQAAANALAEIRDRSAGPALAESLKDPDADVREAAAKALGEIKDRNAVDALIATLKDAKPEVRKAAAVALGEIRDNGAVTALTECLNDEDPDVRTQARRALAEIKGSRY